MNLVLGAKTSSKGIENHKIWCKLPIYHRMNETFFGTKSFIWRQWSPSGKMLFSFEIAPELHSCFLQSSQTPLFSLESFGQSLKFKSKNHKHVFTFCLFTHIFVVSVLDRIVSILFLQFLEDDYGFRSPTLGCHTTISRTNLKILCFVLNLFLWK